jgi:hypothetical protein
MRTLLFALVVSLSACATTAVHPAANIPAIRHQIDDTIAADASISRRTADFQYQSATGAAAADLTAQLSPSRKITAMGHVTPDLAVVYTHPGDAKLEETWVRQPDGWKLARVTELDATPRASASR